MLAAQPAVESFPLRKAVLAFLCGFQLLYYCFSYEIGALFEIVDVAVALHRILVILVRFAIFVIFV